MSSHSKIEMAFVTALKPNPKNARTHSKKQVREIAASIKAFGFTNPILVDETNMVLAGHGRLAAAQFLEQQSVPVVRLDHMSNAEKRAYVLADNKLAEKAGWDRELLAIELGDLALELPQLDLELSITGFDIGEIDQVLDERGPQKADASDDVPDLPLEPVTRAGDLWILGAHRLLCGDARNQNDLDRLMDGEKARMAFLDPPYNVKISDHVQGRGAIKHAEFAFASGEMSRSEFVTFLKLALSEAARLSVDGAIHYICMDWRHLSELMEAAASVYSEQKNLVVWNKSTPGQGSFYRSQHELILVYQVGNGSHRNGIELGKHGRSRSNVWTYPGVNMFRAGRLDELAMHPTVKPVKLISDAMRDCSIKGESVLDTFMGSGSTLMAAEVIGRRAFGVEYEPKYIDVAVRRWETYTKLEAICSVTGMTFAETRATRRPEHAGDTLESSRSATPPDASHLTNSPGSKA